MYFVTLASINNIVTCTRHSLTLVTYLGNVRLEQSWFWYNWIIFNCKLMLTVPGSDVRDHICSQFDDSGSKKEGLMIMWPVDSVFSVVKLTSVGRWSATTLCHGHVFLFLLVFLMSRKQYHPHQRDVHGERRLAELCGAGGDSQSWLHHWLIPVERSHFASGHFDGQIWATPTEAHWQVWHFPHFGWKRNGTTLRLCSDILCLHIFQLMFRCLLCNDSYCCI